MNAMTLGPRQRRRRRRLLRHVAHVEDTGAGWDITLACGHRIQRPKSDGRPTVFNRRECRECEAGRR